VQAARDAPVVLTDRPGEGAATLNVQVAREDYQGHCDVRSPSPQQFPAQELPRTQADLLPFYPRLNLAYPGLQLVHRSPNIFVVHDFLTSNECEQLMAAASADPKVEKSTTNGELQEKEALHLRTLGIGSASAAAHLETPQASQQASQESDYLKSKHRTSKTSNISQLYDTTSDGEPTNHSSPPAKALYRRASLLLGADVRRFESLTVLHYEKGEEYHPHHDTVSANLPRSPADTIRKATLFVYLNDVKCGGETRFPNLDNFTVRPQQGMAVLFFPADLNLRQDARLLHGGMPAAEGHEKWLAVTWMVHGWRPARGFRREKDSKDINLVKVGSLIYVFLTNDDDEPCTGVVIEIYPSQRNRCRLSLAMGTQSLLVDLALSRWGFLE